VPCSLWKDGTRIRVTQSCGGTSQGQRRAIYSPAEPPVHGAMSIYAVQAPRRRSKTAIYRGPIKDRESRLYFGSTMGEPEP